jgi:hypothetical protein
LAARLSSGVVHSCSSHPKCARLLSGRGRLSGEAEPFAILKRNAVTRQHIVVPYTHICGRLNQSIAADSKMFFRRIGRYKKPESGGSDSEWIPPSPPTQPDLDIRRRSGLRAPRQRTGGSSSLHGREARETTPKQSVHARPPPTWEEISSSGTPAILIGIDFGTTYVP